MRLCFVFKMTSRMPDTLDELFRLDPASKQVWMDLLIKPHGQQTAEEQRWVFKMTSQMMQLSNASTSSLSPQLRGAQQGLLGLMSAVESPVPVVLPPLPPHMEHLRDTFQSDLRPKFQGLRRANHLTDVLKPHPELNLLQWKINGMLNANNEGLLFDTPALLNAIAKHLKRSELFERVASLTPSVAELIASLKDLHKRKPDVHIQLCQLLINAALWAGGLDLVTLTHALAPSAHT